MIGDGNQRKELERLTKHLNLSNQVYFLGPITNVSKKLDDIDIFVFSTTKDEGFGIALAEAMVAGIPILASDVGSCFEILGNGRYGNFFKKEKLIFPSEQAIKECLKLGRSLKKILSEYD